MACALQLRRRRCSSLASLGYATTPTPWHELAAGSRIQNDWVHYFMRFNALRLNHGKCELVGRRHHGLPLTEAAARCSGIAIEGHALVPVAHDQPIRYLGVHCRFDGSWDAQQA